MPRVPEELRRTEARMPGVGDLEFWLTALSPNLGLPLDVYAAGRSAWGPQRAHEVKRQETTAVELVLQGTGALTVDGNSYALKPGDVFLLHNGENCEYHGGTGGVWHKLFFILFPGTSGDVVQQLGLAGVHCVHIAPATLPKVARLFHRILALVRRKSPGFRERASVLCYELLLSISGALPAHHPRAQLPSALGTAIRYAEEHMRAPLTARDLCALAHCGTRHLNRLFHQHVGMATRTWLIRSKIQHACHMLLTTHLPIHSIGESVGYPDPYHFSATFRRLTGTPPREYRQAITQRARS